MPISDKLVYFYILSYNITQNFIKNYTEFFIMINEYDKKEYYEYLSAKDLESRRKTPLILAILGLAMFFTVSLFAQQTPVTKANYELAERFPKAKIIRIKGFRVESADEPLDPKVIL